MKSTLRHLTMLSLLAMVAVAAYGIYFAADQHHQQPARIPSQVTPSSGDALHSDPRSEALLGQVQASLDAHRSISAKFRQQSNTGPFELFGAGVYLQQGRDEQGQGGERRLKWELQIQMGGTAASLLQVVDSRFLWTERRLPKSRRVERVDLYRTRRALRNLGADLTSLRPGQASPSVAGMEVGHAIGGLPMMLASLRNNFCFASSRPMQYQQRPVFALRGRWKPDELSQLLQETDDKQVVDVLPPRIPLEILLLVGTSDLFPYLIEYRAATDPATDPPIEGADFKLSSKPLMRLEFTSVAFNVPVDETQFTYTPPEEVELQDGTARYVKQIRERQQRRLAASQSAPSPR